MKRWREKDCLLSSILLLDSQRPFCFLFFLFFSSSIDVCFIGHEVARVDPRPINFPEDKGFQSNLNSLSLYVAQFPLLSIVNSRERRTYLDDRSHC